MGHFTSLRLLLISNIGPWVSFLKYILLIMLSQLSHFPLFIPFHPAYFLPPTFSFLVHVHGSYI